MALYSSNLKTHLIDAVRDQKNKRVEFRLDKVDTVYTSNIRLLNVGISATGGPVYNIILGGLGIVRSIQLLDGNIVLDELVNFSDYVSFKHQNNNNDTNRDINNEMYKNALGFTYDRYALGLENKIMSEFERVSILTTDNDDGAVLKLSDYLDFLKQARILPTSIFQNLRIIINYSSSAINACSVPANYTSTNEPVLVVDEIDDVEQAKALASQFKEVQWEAIETDQVSIAREQSANYTIKGFDGDKLVNRLLVQRKPLTASTADIGTAGSTAMNLLKEQFVVNGRNKLPGFNGIEDNNERLALLVDTFGEFNIVPGGNEINFEDNSNTHVLASNSLIGNQSWTGLVIGERVQEIQYQMQRSTATGAIAHSKADIEHNINFFGEVAKGLVVKGENKYDIVYL